MCTSSSETALSSASICGLLELLRPPSEPHRASCSSKFGPAASCLHACRCSWMATAHKLRLIAPEHIVQVRTRSLHIFR